MKTKTQTVQRAFGMDANDPPVILRDAICNLLIWGEMHAGTMFDALIDENVITSEDGRVFQNALGYLADEGVIRRLRPKNVWILCDEITCETRQRREFARFEMQGERGGF